MKKSLDEENTSLKILNNEINAQIKDFDLILNKKDVDNFLNMMKLSQY